MEADEKPRMVETATIHGRGVSVRTVMKGAAGLTKAALGVGRASEVVIRQRPAICAACPQASAAVSRTSRCQACTCFIHPKTATATEKCPLGRW
jgi:hypothetical protein